MKKKKKKKKKSKSDGRKSVKKKRVKKTSAPDKRVVTNKQIKKKNVRYRSPRIKEWIEDVIVPALVNKWFAEENNRSDNEERAPKQPSMPSPDT